MATFLVVVLSLAVGCEDNRQYIYIALYVSSMALLGPQQYNRKNGPYYETSGPPGGATSDLSITTVHGAVKPAITITAPSPINGLWV